MLSGQEYSVNPYVTKGVVRRHSNTAERTPDMVRKNLKTKKIVEGPKIKQPMNGLKFSWIVGLSGKYFQIHSCLKFSADVHTESISRAIVADLRQGKNRKFEAAIFRRSAFARAYMSDGRPFPPQRFSEAKGRRPPPQFPETLDNFTGHRGRRRSKCRKSRRIANATTAAPSVRDRVATMDFPQAFFALPTRAGGGHTGTRTWRS